MTRARAAVLAALALGFVLAIAIAHQIGVGRRAMAGCDAARAHGDLAGAIELAHEAAESAAPASPYPARGFEALDAMAHEAEARGDDKTAIAALTAMRGAAVATSAANADAWRARADQELARVGSREWAGASRSDAGVRPERSALDLALARSDAASLSALACLGLGALAFFAGAARLLVVARDVSSIVRERAASVAVIAGAILCVLACLR